jgi:hypothetical protein
MSFSAARLFLLLWTSTSSTDMELRMLVLDLEKRQAR